MYDARREGYSEWRQKSREIRGKRYENGYPPPLMYELSQAAGEGMKIVTRQFDDLTNTIKSAAEEARAQVAPFMPETEVVNNSTRFNLVRASARCANYKIRGEWTRSWSKAPNVQACADECMELAGDNCNLFSYTESGPEAGSCLYSIHGCRTEGWGTYMVYEPLR